MEPKLSVEKTAPLEVARITVSWVGVLLCIKLLVSRVVPRSMVVSSRRLLCSYAFSSLHFHSNEKTAPRLPCRGDGLGGGCPGGQGTYCLCVTVSVGDYGQILITLSLFLNMVCSLCAMSGQVKFWSGTRPSLWMTTDEMDFSTV